MATLNGPYGTAILDPFNRNDATAPPSASWGGASNSGIYGATSVNLQDNGANLSVLSWGGSARAWWTTSYGPNCESFVTAKTLPGSGDGVYCFGRIVSPGSTSWTGYFLRANDSSGTQTFQLWKHTAGQALNAETSIATNVNQVWAAGDQIALTCIGSTITGWRYAASGGTAWVPVITASDATFTTAGFIGTGVDFSTGFLTGFGGGTILPIPNVNYAISAV